MCWVLCNLKKLTIELTGNVPVAIFQSVEIQHELPDGDLEDFKQTHVLKERVRHLWRHKKKSANSKILRFHICNRNSFYAKRWPGTHLSTWSLCKWHKQKAAGGAAVTWPSTRTTLVETDVAEDPSSPPSGDVHQVKNLEVPRVHLLHVDLVILQHGI